MLSAHLDHVRLWRWRRWRRRIFMVWCESPLLCTNAWTMHRILLSIQCDDILCCRWAGAGAAAIDKFMASICWIVIGFNAKVYVLGWWTLMMWILAMQWIMLRLIVTYSIGACAVFFVCVETMNGNRITILSIDNVNFTSLLFICIWIKLNCIGVRVYRFAACENGSRECQSIEIKLFIVWKLFSQ